MISLKNIILIILVAVVSVRSWATEPACSLAGRVRLSLHSHLVFWVYL
jgi:hypothetical protein